MERPSQTSFTHCNDGACPKWAINPVYAHLALETTPTQFCYWGCHQPSTGWARAEHWDLCLRKAATGSQKQSKTTE
jgi:hypothetical protein